MSLRDRKQDEVRSMLEAAVEPVPPDLGARAAFRGSRMLRRRQALRAALWVLAAVAVVVFLGWAVAVEPWHVPPAETTPPLEGW